MLCIPDNGTESAAKPQALFNIYSDEEPPVRSQKAKSTNRSTRSLPVEASICRQPADVRQLYWFCEWYSSSDAQHVTINGKMSQNRKLEHISHSASAERKCSPTRSAGYSEQ
jgi:hypothetical protein